MACGCSTHPLPEDVSRKSTFDIVQKLRCEAKAGLSGFESLTFLPHTFIGYDFTFTMTEDDNANSGLLEFKHLIGGGSFALELNGGLEKKRSNMREFRVIESLVQLLAAECNGITPAVNLMYPITGHVGIDEVVRTYLSIEKLTNLKDQNTEHLIFSDTLEYTTFLTGTIKPSLSVNAIAGEFKVTRANISGVADRRDVHKVVIAITRSGTSTSKLARGASLTSQFPGVLSDRRLATPLLQQDADPQTRVLLELERLRNRDEDNKLLGILHTTP